MTTIDDTLTGVSIQPAMGGSVDFEDFVASRGPGLVRLARGLLRNPADAEDVVQDVLARALLRWPTVGAADDVDAYVRTMVINACHSLYRRAWRRREVATDVVPERGTTQATEQVEDRAQLLRLLRRLPAKQRTVLVLRHFEQLTDAEIAAALRCEQTTVRSNAHRGLARLQQLLEAES